MNAENPVQIDLFGVSATGSKDTRLAEQLGGSRARSGRPLAGADHALCAIPSLMPGGTRPVSLMIPSCAWR